MSEITLFQGDCLERMKELPDGSVDMVLTDLPYGTTKNNWDKPINLPQFWSGVSRVLKPNGAAALFSQLPFAADLINSNRRNFRYEWIWEKTQGTGFLNANRMPLKIHENILIFYQRLPFYHPQKTTIGCGGGGYKYRRNDRTGNNYGKFASADKVTTWTDDGTRYPVDIIRFPQANCSSEPKLHPTQKPISLLEYLICTYTNKGETVLDCCMGSGSTGVACVNTKRRFIGMELDDGYFQVAKERIEATQQNQTH